MVILYTGGQLGHLVFCWAIWSSYVLLGNFSLGKLGVGNFAMANFSYSPLSSLVKEFHPSRISYFAECNFNQVTGKVLGAAGIDYNRYKLLIK